MKTSSTCLTHDRLASLLENRRSSALQRTCRYDWPQVKQVTALHRPLPPLLTLRCGGRLLNMTGLPVFLNTGAAARSSARATRSSCSARAADSLSSRATWRRSRSRPFSDSDTCSTIRQAGSSFHSDYHEQATVTKPLAVQSRSSQYRCAAPAAQQGERGCTAVRRCLQCAVPFQTSDIVVLLR
jgi:hypothetical protein